MDAVSDPRLPLYYSDEVALGTLVVCMVIQCILSPRRHSAGFYISWVVDGILRNYYTFKALIFSSSTSFTKKTQAAAMTMEIPPINKAYTA